MEDKKAELNTWVLLLRHISWEDRAWEDFPSGPTNHPPPRWRYPWEECPAAAWTGWSRGGRRSQASSPPRGCQVPGRSLTAGQGQSRQPGRELEAGALPECTPPPRCQLQHHSSLHRREVLGFGTIGSPPHESLLYWGIQSTWPARNHRVWDNLYCPPADYWASDP